MCMCMRRNNQIEDGEKPKFEGKKEVEVEEGREEPPWDQAGVGGDGEYLQSATIN